MKEKIVLCPQCKRGVIHYGGKSTLPIEKKCDKCNKLVVYYPTEDKVKIYRMPQRAQSSGKRFY